MKELAVVDPYLQKSLKFTGQCSKWMLYLNRLQGLGSFPFANAGSIQQSDTMSDRRVLIIDDETDFCLLIKTYLTRKNFEVHISHTLQEGLRSLADVKPDILFLDNNLPDGLGWEQTGYITTSFPGTRLNLISAYHYSPNMAQQYPGVRIWEKPISLNELSNYLN